MNKNLFLGMFAAASMLLATSCSNDELEVVQSGNEAQITFSVGAKSGIGSRALVGDGTKADKLVWAVYNHAGELLDVFKDANNQYVGQETHTGISDMTKTAKEVTVNLAKGQTYKVLFWAQDEDCKAYETSDLKNVEVMYPADAVNNDERRDAFFACKEINVKGNETFKVDLKRPFAQVNVGVTKADWDAAEASGIIVGQSKVVIKNAATHINLMDGSVSGSQEVTYNLANIITDQDLEVDLNDNKEIEEDEKFKYLSMSYILVDDESNTGSEKANLESLEFTFDPTNGNDIIFKDGLTNVPVQRNWRTNIVGQILTGTIKFEVKIDNRFEDDNNLEWSDGYLVDGNTITLFNEKGLKWVAENVGENDGFVGKTIVLANDIDLFQGHMPDGDPVTTSPIGDQDKTAFKGIFDGQGHTIKNLYQNGWALNYDWYNYGSIGLFAELENATVKNVVIEKMESFVEGGDVSFIAGSATGDCVFENIEIKNSTIATYNNGCGGIIGWSGAGTYTFKNIKIGSDVVLGGLWGSFDSSIGGIVGQAESGATYNFENVEINCRIDAYNDCTASYDYYNYRMCGMIIGRCKETTTIDGTNYPDLSKYNLTFNNVVVNYGDWMNYHYCEPTPGYNNGRGMRVEPGYAYDGLPADYDHSQCVDNHMNWIPFDQLIGGNQLGVKGLPVVDGVTVNYPASYITNITISDLSNVTSEKTVELTENLSVSSGKTIHTQNATAAITINGNGKSIVSTANSVDDFQWEGGTIPAMSTIFSSANGSKVTVNDLSFEGTMSALMLGHYQNATYNNYNTELNNVNVIDTKVVSFSSNISPAVCVYGTAVLNNCNIYGTSLSELDTDPMWPVYDVAAVNYSTTTVNGGKIGSFLFWNQAALIVNDEAVIEKLVILGNMNNNNANNYIQINSGAEVKEIDLSKITDKNRVKITIEAGATVGKIVANGAEYNSIEDYKNSL